MNACLKARQSPFEFAVECPAMIQITVHVILQPQNAANDQNQQCAPSLRRGMDNWALLQVSVHWRLANDHPVNASQL